MSWPKGRRRAHPDALTNRELAAWAGLGISTIQKWANGKGASERTKFKIECGVNLLLAARQRARVETATKEFAEKLGMKEDSMKSDVSDMWKTFVEDGGAATHGSFGEFLARKGTTVTVTSDSSLHHDGTTPSPIEDAAGAIRAKADAAFGGTTRRDRGPSKARRSLEPLVASATKTVEDADDAIDRTEKALNEIRARAFAGETNGQ